ncbi:MAG TPA: POTRA domain-containing protein [Candidatus Sulfotelmatobacter sp.]|nr:POTRA domain-containing protein [Candidatus Sulfotelmatobacter sp.]
MLKRVLVCFCFLASFPLKGQAGSHGQALAPVTIRHIVFKNVGVLSSQEQLELTKKVRRDDESPNDAPAAIAEELVREACQNKGYFKVKVSAAAEPVPGNAENRQLDIVVKVLDYGVQYRLQQIHFLNSKAFSEAELVQLVPVQPGEIFSRAKIAEGLEAVEEHYQAAGYVNFTSIPNTEFDEADASVRLNIDVDEGKLFRWGELHITGLDASKTKELTDGWDDLRGRPYSPESLRDFCARFFPAARGTDPAKYTKRKMNEKMGTIDISIAFVSPWWLSD